MLEGQTPMAPSRRSPKKLRLVKSPRTARAAPRGTSRKPASAEGKTARPALRTYDAATARKVGAARKAWEQEEVAKSLARAPARRTEFVTDSGIPIPTVVTPADRAREDSRDLGLPGLHRGGGRGSAGATACRLAATEGGSTQALEAGNGNFHCRFALKGGKRNFRAVGCISPGGITNSFRDCVKADCSGASASQSPSSPLEPPSLTRRTCP